MSTPVPVAELRRRLIEEQSTLNGIDYVEVVPAPAPTQLRVKFINALTTVPAPAQIVVAGGERIPTVAVLGVDTTDEPDTIVVALAGTGDLSLYELRLVTGPDDSQPPPWVDQILSVACFNFDVDCIDGLPCNEQPACPPALAEEPTLDYLARDWESLRAVLLDRLSVLQPDWTERNLADPRIALVELLAELGDRASYRQDQISTEAYLGTARRRISARRHARLVDYAMSDGTNARAWVRFAVPADVSIIAGGAVDVVPVHTRLLTGGPDSPAIVEAGTDDEAAIRRAGSTEFQALSSLAVVAGVHSEMAFYTWSRSRDIVPATSTSATLAGHLPLLAAGQVLILGETRDPVGPNKRQEDAEPTRRQAVRLTEVVAVAGASPLRDPLTGDEITEISWHPDDELAFPLTVAGELPDGSAYLDGAVAWGNVVLADHGETAPPETLPPVPATGRVTFRLARGPLSQVPQQLVTQEFPDGSGTSETSVPFDPTASAGGAITAPPAVVVPDMSVSEHVTGVTWNVRRDLISSGTSRDVVVEVDDDGYAWLRFAKDAGPLVNGARPAPGLVFDVAYRTGNGTSGNVGADSIRTVLDEGTIAAALRAVLAAGAPAARVSNPLPARGGTDPETIEDVRQRAPFAFRVQERAVTADDYARRAEQFGLPGPARIQRAVATIRWTGSWHVVVVAVDPVGVEDMSDAFLEQVRQHIDLYRMAGHDLRVVAAEYAPLEVGLAITVDPDHRRDLVLDELLAVMSNGRLADGRVGIFNPDRLTFGANVYLGPIIAAAQAITGVSMVDVTRFSRYRLPGTDARAAGVIEIGPTEIARLDNDPSRPERGRFYLDKLEGGR